MMAVDAMLDRLGLIVLSTALEMEYRFTSRAMNRVNFWKVRARC